MFAKHGKDWLPAKELDPFVVTPHRSGVDNTFVHSPLMGLIYHSGLQAIIYGSGAPGAWSPGGYDPLKHTIYFNFDEQMQSIFSAMGEYGGRPSTESPEPGDELGNKLKEKASTEPDGDKEKLAPNASYTGGDGKNVYHLRTDSKGHVVDTIKYNDSKHEYDTTKRVN